MGTGSFPGAKCGGVTLWKKKLEKKLLKGIKAFIANKTLFKSNLVPRKSKLKLY